MTYLQEREPVITGSLSCNNKIITENPWVTAMV